MLEKLGIEPKHSSSRKRSHKSEGDREKSSKRSRIKDEVDDNHAVSDHKSSKNTHDDVHAQEVLLSSLFFFIK